jgi:hypothetical protein
LDYPSLPTPHNPHVFLVSKLFNLAILVGKKMKKKMQIQGRMSTTTKIAKNLK